MTERTDCLGQPTRFEYDGAGNLVRVIDALGGATQYRYQRINRRDRVVGITLPDGKSERFAYDALGRLIAHHDARGRATYDQRWIDEVFPLLPEDFDPRFFQAAPIEQQIDNLSGGEEVSFIHLHPSRPELRFVLPRMSLSMVVLDQHRKVHKLAPVVDTLSFDLEAEVFTLVWRARHPLKRSLAEVDALAAGSLCKRWWQARVLGTNDCGCGGRETKDEDQAPVAEIVVA